MIQEPISLLPGATIANWVKMATGVEPAPALAKSMLDDWQTGWEEELPAGVRFDAFDEYRGGKFHRTLTVVTVN